MASVVKYAIVGIAGLAAVKGASLITSPSDLMQRPVTEVVRVAALETGGKQDAAPKPDIALPDTPETEIATDEMLTDDQTVDEPIMAPVDAEAAPGGWSGETMPEILAAIVAEREALKEKAAELDVREASIDLARDAVLQQTDELEDLRLLIERHLVQAEEHNTADVDKLIDIYKSMKPEQAAGILNDADIEVTVLVLSEMSARSSGPIIATMDTVRAQAISKIILERSRLPGDQKLTGIRLK